MLILQLIIFILEALLKINDGFSEAILSEIADLSKKLYFSILQLIKSTSAPLRIIPIPITPKPMLPEKYELLKMAILEIATKIPEYCVVLRKLQLSNDIFCD